MQSNLHLRVLGPAVVPVVLAGLWAGLQFGQMTGRLYADRDLTSLRYYESEIGFLGVMGDLNQYLDFHAALTTVPGQLGGGVGVLAASLWGWGMLARWRQPAVRLFAFSISWAVLLGILAAWVVHLGAMMHSMHGAIDCVVIATQFGAAVAAPIGLAGGLLFLATRELARAAGWVIV